MSKWEMVRLVEICDLNMGQSPESSSYNEDGDGVPFYQGNADFGELTPETRYYCNNPTKLAKKNDILLSVRAPIGAINIATETCCIGRGLAALTAKENLTDVKYLYYIIKQKHAELNHRGTGSTFKAINKQNLSEILCPLPPLEIQKQISKTLDTAADLLTLRKQQLAELDNLIKSTFYDMFGDPLANEKGWSTGIIKDLAIKIQYGTSEKASTEKLSYPILRMNNITYQGNMDYSDLKYIDLSDKDQKKYLVHKGEMLFNRTNSKELVGKTAVFRGDKPMAYAGYLVRLVPNEKASSEFISSYLNSSYGKKLLFKMAKNIVGMANINAQELSNIKIYIPPIELQNQFATIVAKIEEQKAFVKKAIDETQHLFDSLMSEYFE